MCTKVLTQCCLICRELKITLKYLYRLCGTFYYYIFGKIFYFVFVNSIGMKVLYVAKC